MKVTNIVAKDIRFPTSKENLGTDAVHVDCDYSATYVNIETEDNNLTGIGLTFTIGKGNDLCCKSIDYFKEFIIGKEVTEIERDIFNNNNIPTRSEVMEKLIPYIHEETAKGIQLNHIMRHTVGLFHGQNGSRTWKQYLSKNMCIRDADLQKVNHIMDQVRKTNPVSLER